MPRREDHEAHKDMWWHWIKITIIIIIIIITYQFSTQKLTYRLVKDLCLKGYPNKSDYADGTGKQVAVKLKITAN
jgi:hypothetical protein